MRCAGNILTSLAAVEFVLRVTVMVLSDQNVRRSVKAYAEIFTHLTPVISVSDAFVLRVSDRQHEIFPDHDTQRPRVWKRHFRISIIWYLYRDESNITNVGQKYLIIISLN